MIGSVQIKVIASIDPDEVARFAKSLGFTQVGGKPSSWSKQYRMGDSNDSFWIQLDNTEKGLFARWGFTQTGNAGMLVEDGFRPTLRLKNLHEYAVRSSKSFALLADNLKDLETWAQRQRSV